MTQQELDTIALRLWPALKARGLTQDPRGNWRLKGKPLRANKELLPLIRTVDPDVAQYLDTWIHYTPARLYRLNWALRNAASGFLHP